MLVKIKEALKARAVIMFEGKHGAPIASGIKSDAATALFATNVLCRAALEVAFNDLPDVLFDQWAPHRPCGKLDRYEAVGILIGDALGLPLVPPRPQGIAIGKKAKKLKDMISAEVEKEKRAMQRSGGDVSGAAAVVLRRVVALPLPTAEECLAGASAALDPAPLPTELSPTESPPLPPAPTPPPPPGPPPHGPPPPGPPPPPPAGKLVRLFRSRLTEWAISAAMGCELAQTWLREGVDTPIGVQPGWEAYDSAALEVRQEHRLDLYLDLLIEIKQQYPMKVCCHLFEIGGCRHGIRCECGGTQAPWPWIVHHPHASPFCECHLELRQHWMDRDSGPSSSAELVALIQRAEASRFRPEHEKVGYRTGCTCCGCCYSSDSDSEL